MTSDKAERGSKVAKAKVLTQTDIDSGKYTIRDVILTLPGYAVIYPAGKLGEMYREILASDKLNIDDMFRKQKCVSAFSLACCSTLITNHTQGVLSCAPLLASDRCCLADPLDVRRAAPTDRSSTRHRT